MIQPPPRVGAFRAALILIPQAIRALPGLARSVPGAFAAWATRLPRVGRALATLALSLTLAGLFITLALPLLGLLAERYLGGADNNDKVYYATGVSTLPTSAAGVGEPRLEAANALIRQRREEAIALGAPFFSLRHSERQLALTAIDERRAALREQKAQADAQAWRRDSEIFFSALRSGKTLPQAVSLVSGPAPAPPTDDAEPAELARLKRELLGARAVWLPKTPIAELFIPWGRLVSPKGGPDGWAIAQPQSRVELGFSGFMLTLLGLIVCAALLLARSLIRDFLDRRQDALREALDRQSVRRAVGPARSPSKTPRL